MHGKRRGTAVVTESAVQAALRRGPARALAPDEERLMRMRVGASLPLSARLERIAVATDHELELLSYEIEAWLHMKERAASAPAPRLHPARSTPSRTKEKIVRALRHKA